MQLALACMMPKSLFQGFAPNLAHKFIMPTQIYNANIIMPQKMCNDATKNVQ